MAIKCSLEPAVASMKIFSYLYTNPRILDLDKLIVDLTDIIFAAESDIRTLATDYKVDDTSSDLGTYLPRFVAFVQAQIPYISLELGKGSYNFQLLLNSDTYELADAIGGKILETISKENSSKEEVESIVAEEKKIDELDVIVNSISADNNNFLLSEEFGSLRSSMLVAGELPIEKIWDLYFSEAPDAIEDFKKYFLTTYSNNLIERRVSGKRLINFSSDIDTVLTNTLADIEEDIDNEILSQINPANLAELDNNSLKVYFAKIITSEFSSVVKAYLPGVTQSEEKGWDLTGKETYRRTFTTEDGAVGGFDQTSHFTKMILNTTERIVENNGVLSQDTNSPYINDYELKMIVNDLGSLPKTKKEFIEAFRNLVEGATALNGEAGIVLRSIYHKFLSPEEYTLDGVTYVSVNTLGEEGEEEAISLVDNLISSITSMQALEHVVVKNNDVYVTKTRNTDAAFIFQNQFMNNITHNIKKDELKAELEKAIQVIETEDGKFKIFVAGTPISFSYKYKDKEKGVMVEIDNETSAILNDTNKAVKILKALRFPYSDNFVKYYKDNFRDYAAQTVLDASSLSIGNFIGNLAYMVASNSSDPEKQRILKDHGYKIETDEVNLKQGVLPFPVFDFLYAFVEPVTIFIDKTEGNQVKKQRLDVHKNKLNVVGVKSRLYEFKNIINEQKSKGEDTIFRDNSFVNNNYQLQGYAAKNGIESGLIVKSNGDLTLAEQFKYLIVDNYFKVAAENNFKTAHIQMAVMSDRSLIELLIVNSSNNVSDFMPKNFKEMATENLTVLQNELYQDQKSFHNELANKIINIWKIELNTWVNNKNIDIPAEKINNISTIEDLQNLLKTTDIPVNLVKQSTNLVKDLMYVEFKKSDGTKGVQLKSSFLLMYEIWNNEAEAQKFMRSLSQKFKYQVISAGLNADNLMRKDPAVMDLLMRHFNEKSPAAALNNLLEIYFYKSNIISNSAMNLQMGTVYQFPGDYSEDIISDDDLNLVQLRETLENNDKLSKEEIEARLKKGKRTLALSLSMNEMYVNQSKRNASLGSGYQRPVQATKNEEGGYLDEYTNTALISDPNIYLQLLGDLQTELDQDIYDASMFAHPLYFLKTRNSLGGKFSNFVGKGGAIKDISCDIDDLGVFRYQKKATFNLFSNEILSKGSIALNNLFRKMNETIQFSAPLIYEGETLLDEFSGEPIKNMQELWEYFGATSNENSWEDVLNVLAKNPQQRMAYIEKIGFKSGEKSGNRGFNDANIWDTSKPLIYTPFSNKFHGIILNPDHDPDSTTTEEAEKSLMTQTIAATVFEGETIDISNKINEALSDLTNASLTGIKEEVFDEAVSIFRKLVESKDPTLIEYGTFEELEALANVFNENDENYTKLYNILHGPLNIYQKGSDEYVRKLTEKAIKTRESFGIATDLIQPGVAGGMKSLQMHQAINSAVMAHLNKQTTRIKFKGQEFVLSASHHFVRLFPLKDTKTGKILRYVTRDEFLKNPNLQPTSLINNKEAWDNLIDSDLVEVNGESHPFWKVKKMVKSFEDLSSLGTVTAKVALDAESRPLSWLKYKNNINNEIVYLDQKDANGNYIYPLYKELLDLGTQINEAKDIVVKRDLIKQKKFTEFKLKEFLKDPKQKWETELAEFYMPMMHMRAFNLENPETGEPDDILLSDILGYEQSGEKLYFANGKETKTPSDKTDMVFESEFNSMVNFFRNRIYLHDDIKPGVKYKALNNFKKLPIKLTIQQVLDLKEKLNKELSKLPDSALEKSALKNEIDFIEKTVAGLGQIDTTELLSVNIINQINENRLRSRFYYTTAIAEAQARSFIKTLNILAARVPGQGKQSYVAGKVSGFINSNRNALYGPVQLLKVSGADHDVDKAHVIVFSVDKFGRIYDYTDYIENDKISAVKYKEILNARLNNEVSSALSIKDRNIKIANIKKEELHRFRESIKNFILDNLIDTVKSTKNALEFSTPITMQGLKDLISEIENLEVLDDEQGEGGVITGSKRLMSNFNPASIPQLEMTNGAGKSGISIFATGIKGYSASTVAFLENLNSPYLVFGNEMTRLWGSTLNKNYKDLENLYQEYFGQKGEESLVLYTTENSKIKPIFKKTLANTDKWKDESQKNLKDYRFLVDDLRSKGKTDKEIDEILNKEAADLLDKITLVEGDTQAWDNLSQLLSAATDNAKELILGRLNLTNVTSGLVVAGVGLGFDLKEMLLLLQDRDVIKILKEVEDSEDTLKTFSPENLKLETVIKAYLKENFGKDNMYKTAKIAKLYKEAKQYEVIPAPITARDISRQAGVSSSKDLKVIYNTGMNIGNIPLTSTSTDINVDISEVDILQIQQIAKIADLDFNRLDIKAINNVLQTIKNAGTIIITKAIENDEVLRKFVKAYGKINKTDTNIYVVQEKTWKKFNPDNNSFDVQSSDFTPVFTSTTAVLGKNNFTADSFKLFNNALHNTKNALDNPALYNEKLEDIKNTQAKLIESKQAALEEELYSYLNNGPRQLLQFVKIAQENFAITNILAINQDLPNLDWDVLNYYQRFINVINSIDPLNYKISKDKFYQFIEAVNNKDEKVIKEFIEEYENIKFGINPFYVLAQNKHYFSYISALRFGQNLIESATFSHKAIDYLIETVSPNGIKQDGLRNLKNFIFGVSIDKFFNESLYKEIKVADRTFKLTTGEGRDEFIKEMYNIISEAQFDPDLSSNLLIQRLKSETSYDQSVGESLYYFKTGDLNNMTLEAKGQLRLSLKKLKNSDNKLARELHDALFFYTLILNKGARDSSSFASLYSLDLPAFSDYTKFLDTITPESIFKDISNMSINNILLNNYNVIPGVNTYEKGIYLAAGSSVEDAFYKLADTPKQGPVIKSNQTGKIYVWDERTYEGKTLGYVVVNATRLSKTIPYSINDDVFTDSGWQFGETAIIDEDKTKGQVLKYIGPDYLVSVDNTLKLVSKETLDLLNTNMIFSGKNFGKIPVKDLLNKDFDKSKSNQITSFWNIKLDSKAANDEISNGTRRYVVYENIQKEYETGEVIGSVILGNGKVAELVYKGFMKVDPKKNFNIVNKLGKNKKFNAFEINFKKGEAPGHLVEYRPLFTENTPKLEIPISKFKGSFLGGDISKRIAQSNATHFVSAKNIQIEEGASKLMVFSVGGTGIKNERWFKVTNLGNFRNYVQNSNVASDSLLDMLGYTQLKNVNLALGNENNNIFVVEPYNARVDATNSYAEYVFLGDEIKPNLEDKTINILESDSLQQATKINNLVESFGAKINKQGSTILSKEEEDIANKIIEDKTIIYENKELSSADLTAINAVNLNENIVIVDDFSFTNDNIAEAKGLIPERPLTVEENAILKYLNANITDVPNYIDSLVADIEANKNIVDNANIAYLLQMAKGNLTRLKHNLTAIKLNLTLKPTLNNELKYVNFGSSFAAAQAAKYMNKNLFIYSPSREQWYTYDHFTGIYKESLIPSLVDNTLLISKNISNDKTIEVGLDSLLKKASNFKDLQDSGLYKLKSINQLGFPTLLPTEEINEVVEVPSPLENVEGILSLSLNDFKETIISEEDNSVIRGINIDGKTFTINEFKKWENTEVKQLADGTITIEGKNVYNKSFFWVYFPDENVRQSYGDYKGETIKTDLKVKIGEQYYVFSELHNTDKDAFLRRDLLLDEKAKLKEKFDIAQEIFDTDVAPLYKDLRYGTQQAFNKFKYYYGYNSFVKNLRNGLVSDLTVAEKAIADELIEKDRLYRLKQEEAWELYRDIRNKATRSVPKVKGIQGSIFDSSNKAILEDENTTLVYLTDNTGNDNLVSKNVKISTVDRLFIPVFFEDNSSTTPVYKLNAQKYIDRALNRIIDIAKSKTDQQFYIEMPADLMAKFYGDVTGLSTMKALARAIAKQKVKGIPENIIFTQGSANGEHIINKYRNGLDPSNINSSSPFSVTRDAAMRNTYNVNSYNFLANFKIGEETLEELWNKERGFASGSDLKISITQEPLPKSDAARNKFESYKNLWRRWAEYNFEAFEQLAMEVGNKALYDPIHSTQTNFSTGRALAELLTEYYVDNSWLDYPRNTLEAPLRLNQMLLPISQEDFKNLNFTTRKRGGKALLSLNGKTYVATIENVAVKPEEKITAATISKLGLEDNENPIAELDKDYPFTINSTYATVLLQEFKEELKEAKAVTEGTFSALLKNSNLEISQDYLKLAEKATIAYGIDTKAKISKTLEGTLVGTTRIRDIKAVIGDGLVLDPTATDKVWVYGSYLEEGNNPETISNALNSVKLLIDKALAAGSEILVGTGSGIEEELRAYIEAKDKSYVRTESGYKRDAVEVDMKEDIYLWKDFNTMRFNANNILGREGKELTGAWGTILYQDPAYTQKNKYEYRLAVDKTEIQKWDGFVSSRFIFEVLETMGVSVGNSDFSRYRGLLLVSEQNFVRRAIAGYLLKDKGLRFYNTNDFDQYFYEQLNNPTFSEEFNKLQDIVFNSDGTFKTSDVGALAMARNRNTTINFMRELLPEVFNSDFESHPLFELFNKERKNADRTKEYFKLINNEVIDKNTAQLILDAKNITFRDAYNLLKTFGPKKIISKQGQLSGQLLNQILVNRGTKVIKDNDKFIVLDNNLIYNNQTIKTSNYDTAQKEEYPINETENKIAISSPVSYRYLKNKGALRIDPYSGEIRVIINNNLYTYPEQEGVHKDIIKDLRKEVLSTYISPLKGLEFTEDQINLFLKPGEQEFVKIQYLLDDHMRYNKPIFGNNYDAMFFRTPKDVLPKDLDKLMEDKIGTLYDSEFGKVFTLRDTNGWIALAQNGKLYRYNLGTWQEQVGINNKPVLNTTETGIAKPNAIGDIFNSLITTNNEQIFGEFQISEVYENEAYNEAEIFATDLTSNAKYRWETFGNAWVEVSTDSNLGQEAFTDQYISTGNKVISLNTKAGNIILVDGIAKSETLVEDAKGTYQFKDGYWEISTTKGGFQNPNIKFQKDKVLYKDEKGAKLASKSVSKDVLRLSFNRLFAGLNVEARLLNADTIALEYGAEFAAANGFVLDGVVVINLDKATLDTPLHELGGHIYMAGLKQENLEAYTDIINRCLQHDIVEDIRKRYPKSSEEDLGEEVFATLFGLQNQSKLSEQQLSKWQKILNIAQSSLGIFDFFKKAIGIIFGSDYKYDLDLNDSLTTIMNKLGDNIIFGDKSALTDLPNLQKNKLAKVVNPFMSDLEVEQELIEKGYIKQICF